MTQFVENVYNKMKLSENEFINSPSKKQIEYEFELLTFNENEFEDYIYEIIKELNSYAYVDYIEENRYKIGWEPIICDIEYEKINNKYVFKLKCYKYEETDCYF
jgi:hypothetical protein